MVYITGDTHGDFTRFSNKHFGKFLTENDFVIVCGVLGLLWYNDCEYKYWLKFISNLKFTLLWVSGNHENYHMLYEFSVEKWHGGKVRHIIPNKCIYLERGQIFNIENKTFFTFGGAQSHDISGDILNKNDPLFKIKRKKAINSGLPFRILNESWLLKELPINKELEEGLSNLLNVNNNVDFIITHCTSTYLQNNLTTIFRHTIYEPDCLTTYFESLETLVTFKHWYFGHYHANHKIDEHHTLIYKGFISTDAV